MDDVTKQKLLEQFRELLDDDSVQLDEQSTDDVDLYSLFSELVAIKNEVRLQANQFKSALDLVAEDKATHQQQIQQARQQAKDEAIQQQSKLLQQLLELRDRIESGVQLADQYQPATFSLTGRRRDKRMIRSLIDGQQLSLSRLDQILKEANVVPITTLGRPFDPAVMNAVGISHDPAVEDGAVSKQIRRGYCWQEKILRIADVVVNRIEKHV